MPLAASGSQEAAVRSEKMHIKRGRFGGPFSKSRQASSMPAVTEAPAAPASNGAGAFVDPGDDGACPLTHPVKAKLASGIYHVPGGGNYERTKPDRCYASAEAAEADGLRPAKR